ncbi:intraflagellar transport protein 74 homolog [Daphnia pulicaria]|uniref:intraflagellar transport protein 74 homolog n=1 Tax=Daphnia pulicaria TaxID=35523 RepID=UPI001EEB98F2|nr:intraflagellar transport protein 74 homolog [Daphnia pulicaria]
MERPQTRRGSSDSSFWEQQQPESNNSSQGGGDGGITNSSSRPLTRMANEYGVQKPAAGIMSAGFAQRISTVNRPGSRVGTAASGANAMRAVTAYNYNAAAVERPTTQQGLGGLKTASRGLPQRQIQDKSYYLGVLRAKMTEVNAEMAKLTKGIEKNNKELQSLPSLEKRVKEMAAEITDLQSQAADLNLLQEKIAISSDAAQMEIELQSLLVQNEREAHDAEDLFDVVKTVKEKIAALEREIQMENDEAEKFITTLTPGEQEKYSQLRTEQNILAKEVENTTTQLSALETRARKLEEELRPFPAKEEMFRLRKTVVELEFKHEQMKEQDAKRLDPEGERAQLVASVKSDNAEVAAMEQQIKELLSETERLQNELQEIDNTFEESQSERGQKYRDLRKREQVMDEFLNSWEDNYAGEMDRLRELETLIMQTLNKVGKQQSLMQLVPSISEYSTAKEDYLVKEGELEKSRATVEGIAIEYQRLQNNLQKMEDLENKIQGELKTLKDQLETIQTNSIKFTGVDDLRHETEERRNRLLLEQDDLADKKSEIQARVNQLQVQCDNLQVELDKNETHVTLHVFDEKLRLLEEDNESMSKFINEIQTTYDVPARRDATMEIVRKYMDNLQLTYT